MKLNSLDMLAHVASSCKNVKRKRTVTFKKPVTNKYHMELMVNGEIYRVVSKLSDSNMQKALKSLKFHSPWENSLQLSITLDGVTKSRTRVITEAESKKFSVEMTKNRRWTKICSK